MRNIRGLLSRQEAPVEAPEPAHERCLSCEADLEGSRMYERYRVCHSCGFHFHLTARERLATLLDTGTFKEDDRGVTSIDPLSFQARQSYRSQVINAQRRTGLTESALTGTGAITGRQCVVAVLDFSFLGGSIGVVAGERLARAFEKAAARRVPIVTICSTAGTRMQEGLLALMQLPRVIAAVRKFDRAGLPHITVLTDPTTGSAYTGFVSMADVVIAEPNALVGYAALRLLEETEGHELPAGAHTAEAHLRHGLIDAVIARPDLRDALSLLLDVLLDEYRANAPHRTQGQHPVHSPRGAWQQVQLSRHERRPTSLDFIGRMTDSFFEIRGDRSGEDDRSVIAGFATIGRETVMIIGQQRPHDGPATEGWSRPAGFRKATRAMALAGKFRIPVVTLIDTSGALPSIESEEAGLGYAIAHCMAVMIDLPVPTVAVIIGEGNSEGAVAMAVADRVLMLDNAVYEVIRPEEAARILFQESSRAGEAAEGLRITSHDCLKLGIIDATVPEPGDGAHTNHVEAAHLLRRAILRQLTTIQRTRPKRLLERRYARYRQTGSTHSWVRGTLERRLAHLTDRIAAAVNRVRRRPAARTVRDFGDHPDIPV